MSSEAEAAGDVLTGAVVAGAVERAANAPGEQAQAPTGERCKNCQATVSGSYCANCGQAAHLHRSLVSLGHDILHGAFHFEGKIWRTIPELFFHPGRLTRRYIDGERAKFVSPMALFLFTVFLMFAVFSFTSGSLLEDPLSGGQAVVGEWRKGNQSAIDQTSEQIEAAEAELASGELTPERRAVLEEQLADLRSALVVMEALREGDFGRIAELKEPRASGEGQGAATPDPSPRSGLRVDFGWQALEQKLNASLEQANSNPSLLLYKLKTNSYKFSWALIPLSVPFLWLMFFWRRDIHLYDHAIFTTYSISFMMLLIIVVSVAAMAGTPGWLWGSALSFVPPIHLYKQLRDAYGLSRFGAYVRLFMLLLSAMIVLTIFLVLLLLLGVFG